MARHLPPKETRFPPGKSPNPSGRPPGARNKRPKMRTPALDETTRYRVNGVLKRMPLREAIMLYAQHRTMASRNPKLRKLLLASDEKLKRAAAAIDYENVDYFILGDGPRKLTSVEGFMQELGLGRLVYPGHSAQRVAFELSW